MRVRGMENKIGKIEFFSVLYISAWGATLSLGINSDLY